MPAVELSRRDKERLKSAYCNYRETGEALDWFQGRSREQAVHAHNNARTRLLNLMFECGVSDLSEAFTPAEMAEMLD
jgi:phage terminase small subunit